MHLPNERNRTESDGKEMRHDASKNKTGNSERDVGVYENQRSVFRLATPARPRVTSVRELERPCKSARYDMPTRRVKESSRGHEGGARRERKGENSSRVLSRLASLPGNSRPAASRWDFQSRYLAKIIYHSYRRNISKSRMHEGQRQNSSRCIRAHHRRGQALSYIVYV